MNRRVPADFTSTPPEKPKAILVRYGRRSMPFQQYQPQLSFRENYQIYQDHLKRAIADNESAKAAELIAHPQSPTVDLYSGGF